MKINHVKTLFYLFAVLVLAASFTFAQDSTKSKPSNHKHKMEMKMDMKGMNMNNMKMDMNSTNAKVDSSIIRSGVIDLKAMDKNKDGKVYEDMMDYNVISDKPGKCPICGMTLKKVTLAKAKANLAEAGFKVK